MSTNDTPLLGRCKSCDYVIFSTRENVQSVEDFRGVKANGVYQIPHTGFFSRCTNGHKAFVCKAVKGTYSKDHKCDSRCLNAKGHDCTCSCGGANHGRGHAIEVVEASAPTIVSNEVEPASEKQEHFLHSLLAEREIPSCFTTDTTGDERRQNAIAKLNNHEFTKRQASKTIEWLLSLPKIED